MATATETQDGTLTKREMYREIKNLCVTDNTTNAIAIAREYLILTATAGGCIWTYYSVQAQGWPLWMSLSIVLPVYLLCIAIIGGWVQNRLGVLIHEASHYSLFKNRVLNDIAANLFLLFPVFGVIHNYRVGHWSHHRHVNDPQHDPDLHRLTRHHPRDFPIAGWKFWKEYVIKQVLPHKGISYLTGRALYVAIPMKSEPVKNHNPLPRPVLATMRISYYIALFSILSIYGWWPEYLLLWIVPFLTFYPAVLFLREIAHHGNYPDDGDFTNSRYYKANWFERQVFFPFGEHNHVMHHMFPTVPHKQMDQAHEMMLRYPPYRDQLVTCNGFFMKADRTSDEPTVLDILAHPADHYARGREEPEEHGEIREQSMEEVGKVD